MDHLPYSPDLMSGVFVRLDAISIWLANSSQEMPTSSKVSCAGFGHLTPISVPE